jgi:tRNA threonylcarbamoyladenosine biosynthesis protein TsaB
MTTLLAIDTATSVMSVAVCDEHGVRAEVARPTRGADLMLLVDEACRTAAVAGSDLDAIAVGAGPGSFTGLRIGMATAKGIAYAIKRPLWAVSSLAALARGSSAAGVVVAVLDARRGEVFAGAYRVTDGATIALADERALPPAELDAFADGVRNGETVHFVGDAASAYPALRDLPGEWGRTPRARDVARCALADKGEDVLLTAVPIYVRRPDAEIMYPDGVPGALRKR